MPDFMVDSYLSAQKASGITPWLLERHEIENYLLEPLLISAAAAGVGKAISADEVRQLVLSEAQALKAEARRASRECGRIVNRHLPEKKNEAELDIETDKWFDALDLGALDVVQRVFPGKELLSKVLQKVSAGHGKQVTKGSCVAAMSKEMVSSDLQKMFSTLAEGASK